MSDKKYIFNNGTHQNILLEDFGHGKMVQANVHFIVDNGQGFILDPGGQKVFKHLMSEVAEIVGFSGLKFIFLSHQDPDIVASINGWLMTTKAEALSPSIWDRFIPHFGVDSLLVDRIKPIADEGTIVKLGNSELLLLPAHFLHSCGNMQVYDPISKILYSGDLGASLGQDYEAVTNFNDHIKYMAGFHKRYIPSRRIIETWLNMIRQLDIEIIAPQHGAYFQGKEMVNQFYDWIASFDCGIDIIAKEGYKIPTDRFN